MIHSLLLNLHDYKTVLEQQSYEFMVEILELVPNLTKNHITFPTFESSNSIHFRSTFKDFCSKFRVKIVDQEFDKIIFIEGTEIGHFKVLDIVWRYDDTEVFVEAKISIESLFDGTEGEIE